MKMLLLGFSIGAGVGAVVLALVGGEGPAAGMMLMGIGAAIAAMTLRE